MNQENNVKITQKKGRGRCSLVKLPEVPVLEISDVGKTGQGGSFTLSLYEKGKSEYEPLLLIQCQEVSFLSDIYLENRHNLHIALHLYIKPRDLAIKYLS